MAAAGVLAQPARDHFQHMPTMYSSHSQAPSYEPSRSLQQSDGFKPSLPSISNLINLADGEKKAQRQMPTRPRLPSPTQLINDSRPTSHPTQISPRFAPLEVRPRYASQEADSRPWSSVAPTSHFRSDSVMSAASRSPTSPSIGSPFGHGSPLLSRESSDPTYFKRQCTSNPGASPYAGSHYGSPASYTSSPEMSSARSLHSHPDSAIQPPPPSVGGLYAQRPLPTSFPAGASPSTASSRSTPMSPTENPYQHHHYLGTSAQSAFPQPQDRYLCPTCNKAFSRPSSLKIHMHSHTGEKPFRCPHRGCGKSFSVRSNMKRHERGCHSEMASASP